MKKALSDIPIGISRLGPVLQPSGTVKPVREAVHEVDLD